MKPRHAAALVLMGWYLMVPPSSGSHPQTAPLSGWLVIRGYDSAGECEAVRATKTQPPSQAVNDLVKKYAPPGKWVDLAPEINPAARCVATDDPLLAK
jgi:hypothetical protein